MPCPAESVRHRRSRPSPTSEAAGRLSRRNKNNKLHKGHHGRQVWHPCRSTRGHIPDTTGCGGHTEAAKTEVSGGVGEGGCHPWDLRFACDLAMSFFRRSRATASIQVEGCRGNAALLNGTYRLKRSQHNGRPQYRKGRLHHGFWQDDHEDIRIFWRDGRRWAIGPYPPAPVSEERAALTHSATAAPQPPERGWVHEASLSASAAQVHTVSEVAPAKRGSASEPSGPTGSASEPSGPTGGGVGVARDRPGSPPAPSAPPASAPSPPVGQPVTEDLAPWASSAYRIIYEAGVPPKYPHELWAAVHTLLKNLCDQRLKLPEEEADRFFRTLQHVVLAGSPSGAIDLVAHTAARLWNCSERLQGASFGRLLNVALRSTEPELLGPAVIVARALNLLALGLRGPQLDREHTHVYPKDGRLYRSGDLPEKYWPFFIPGKVGVVGPSYLFSCTMPCACVQQDPSFCMHHVSCAQIHAALVIRLILLAHDDPLLIRYRSSPGLSNSLLSWGQLLTESREGGSSSAERDGSAASSSEMGHLCGSSWHGRASLPLPACQLSGDIA